MTNHAIETELPAPPETVLVEDRVVACDGGGEPFGHPRVFLTMGNGAFVDCPYCGRRFVLATGDDAGP